MATVIARNVGSTPARTPAETSDVIIGILAPDDKSSAKAELKKVAGVIAATISSEAGKDDAFVLYGSGPQIRVYCIFGDDAISGDGVNEDELAESPTDGDWRLSIPCLEEDLDWIQKKLKSLSSRVTARAIGESVEYEKTQAKDASTGLVINLQEFLKS
jgi:hypothetical protein